MLSLPTRRMVRRHGREREEWLSKGMEQQLRSVDIQLPLPGLARLGCAFRLAKMTDSGRITYPQACASHVEEGQARWVSRSLVVAVSGVCPLLAHLQNYIIISKATASEPDPTSSRTYVLVSEEMLWP